MKRGLLLAAFVVTLILDMGAGPVFIVYASLNLNKNAAFPAATWLLVRGIFNCIQFLTVMALCYLVNRIKRLYSHKEEYLVVGNLLATHPVAFFYYCVILAGIVWNSLGSGWISTAFKDYICIVLSWISVIISPTFVFCGGLVYKRAKIPEPPRGDETLVDRLIQDEEVLFDVKKILAQFEQEGMSLSVDDILWRNSHHEQQQQQQQQMEFTPAGDEVVPVVVTDIVNEENGVDERNCFMNPILDDLTNKQVREDEESGVVKIVSDVLEEGGGREREEEMMMREILERQQAEVLNRPSLTVSEGVSVVVPATVAPLTTASTVVPTTVVPASTVPTVVPASTTAIPTSTVPPSLHPPSLHPPPPSHNPSILPSPSSSSPISSAATPSSSTPLSSSQPTRKKDKTKKKYNKKNQPKECVVSVDSVISSSQLTSSIPNLSSFHEEESYSNEYIDLSQQMIQQVNNGAFDKNQQNENVNVTYIS